MKKRYKNSPLIEATCEFQFEQDAPWNPNIEGLISEKLHATFPKWHQVAQINTFISATPEITEPLSEASHLIQFLRNDEQAIIQIGPHTLAVSHLKPYPSWSEFLALIDGTLKTYREVANPKRLDSIRLHYINRIEIIGEDIRLGDYFEFSPFVGKRMPQSFGAFIVGIQVPYENERDILRLQSRNISIEQPNLAVIILELSYVLMKPGEVALDDINGWLNMAHSRIEESFEACITDQLRNIFEEVTE
jgi:uncharacterized protein (TIGR04255 family)